MTLSFKYNYYSINIAFFALLSLKDVFAAQEYPKFYRGSVCLYSTLFEPLPNVSPLDRTAEIEIPLSSVLDYLTTTNHKIESLFNYKSPNQSSQIDHLLGQAQSKERYFKFLKDPQKKQVLDTVTQNQVFFDNGRKIKGLEFKKDKPHPFSDFQNYIELGSPRDAGNVRTVELHLRLNKKASEVALRARQAAREAGLGTISLHTHLTFPIRLYDLKTDPYLEITRTIDFIRRAELISQMNMTFETVTDLIPKVDSIESNIIHMKPMAEPAILLDLVEAFTNKAYGKPLNLLTKNYIGFRGETFYDRPGIFGIEARSLHKNMNDSMITSILDGFEYSGYHPHFGYSKDKIKEWLQYEGLALSSYAQAINLGSDRGMAFATQTSNFLRMSKLLYPNYVAPLKEVLPELSAQENQIWKMLFNKTKLMTKQSPGKLTFTEDSPLLKLILHSWSNDPIFYDQPQILQKIEVARIRALRKLLREEPLTDAAREYLLDSGLYQELGRSMGIQINPVSP